MRIGKKSGMGLCCQVAGPQSGTISITSYCGPPPPRSSDTCQGSVMRKPAWLLLLFLRQPPCLLVSCHGDLLAPEPQSLTHTCYYILHSVLLTMDFSFNLIPSPSSAFRIPQKCLAHEGHSVAINFFNESSVTSRCEDWGWIGKPRPAISLPS